MLNHTAAMQQCSFRVVSYILRPYHEINQQIRKTEKSAEAVLSFEK